MSNSIILRCLCLSLLLSVSLSALSFENAMASADGVYTVTEGTNGKLLKLTNTKGFAWVLSDLATENFIITLKCTTANTRIITGWGPSDKTNFPDAYSYSGQIMPLLGNSGPTYKTDYLTLYYPSAPAAGTSALVPTTFDLDTAYRWDTSSSGGPFGQDLYSTGTTYASPGPKMTGPPDSSQGMAFEILGCGTATFCIQTDAQAASNVGVCDTSTPTCSAPICESVTNQVNCYDGAAPIIHDGVCLSQCPANTISGSTNGALLVCGCTSPCKYCSTSLTTCTSCVSGYYLYEDTCVNPCPDGYVADDSTSTCKKMVIAVSESKSFATWKLCLAIALPIVAVLVGITIFIYLKLKGGVASKSSAKYTFDNLPNSPASVASNPTTQTQP